MLELPLRIKLILEEANKRGVSSSISGDILIDEDYIVKMDYYYKQILNVSNLDILDSIVYVVENESFIIDNMEELELIFNINKYYNNTVVPKDIKYLRDKCLPHNAFYNASLLMYLYYTVCSNLNDKGTLTTIGKTAESI